MSLQAPSHESTGDEIVRLIATLHATERRLEVLTRGEVDTVIDEQGRTLLLSHAQKQVHRNTLAMQAMVLDALPVNIALLDAEGTIVSVNQTWRNFANANSLEDPDWGAGRNYLEVCDNASGRTCKEAGDVAAGIRSLLQGKTQSFSLEYPCHSPTEQRWFLLTAAPLSAGTNGIVVMHLNITVRRKALEILKQSEQRFSAAFEYAPIGVALVSPDGEHWLRANRALCDLLGYSEQELQQLTVQEISHPDDAAPSLAQVRRGIDDKTDNFQLEKRYVHRNGHVIDVLISISLIRDPSGTPLYFVKHILDMTARNVADRQLRASNVKFHQLADNITDAFWIRSADMNEVQYVSPAFERIWGRSPESLYTSPHEWSKFVLPEDRKSVRDASREIAGSSPTVDIEYRIIRPDGEIRWVHVRGTQVRDATGTITNIIGIATDITDRKRVASELQIERQRLVLAQQVAKVGDWETDLTTFALRWSEETHRIFETDPETPISHSGFLELVHPDDRAATAARFRESLEQREPHSEEHRVLLPDGRVKYVEGRWQVVVDSSGTPVRAIGTCQDISERKIAEIALRDSQHRLRDIIDGLGPSIFVGLLTPQGVIIEVSRPALHETVSASNEIIGRAFVETDWWTDLPDERQRVHDAIERGSRGEPSRFDLQRRGRGGTLIDIDFSLQPLFDTQGNVLFLVPSAIVITERKQAEAALRHSQKLEAVGRLAAGVAHEFNNILQTLMSMATIARIRAVSPEIVRIAGEMEVQLRRGAEVTRQLLAASRHQELIRTRVDLCDQVRTARDLLQRLIPENIEIRVELCPGSAMIEADAGQLQQVLLNLAINARDAMPGGGVITLRVLRNDDEVALEVEDNGEGFDDDAREHLFEPFFTTKEAGAGTGLGLAVVYGIVEQHGGRIEAHSTVGSGSLFRMTIPRTPGELEVAVAVEQHATAAVSGHILLVEDEEGVREGLTMLLTLEGYEVTAVPHGEEALALPVDPAPDLLLSDLSLPGIGGVTLATALCARWPSLKVTLMTGYLEDPMRDTARLHGWDVLHKPFNIDTLSQHLAQKLGTRSSTVPGPVPSS
jgi:two-component system cell cycle sensor histidine kinase/response regulator CckA